MTKTLIKKSNADDKWVVSNVEFSETFMRELDLYIGHKIREAEERHSPGMSGRSAAIEKSRERMADLVLVICQGLGDD